MQIRLDSLITVHAAHAPGYPVKTAPVNAKASPDDLLACSLSCLSKIENKFYSLDNITQFERFCENFWLSNKEIEQQKADIGKARELADAVASIAEQLATCDINSQVSAVERYNTFRDIYSELTGIDIESNTTPKKGQNLICQGKFENLEDIPLTQPENITGGRIAEVTIFQNNLQTRSKKSNSLTEYIITKSGIDELLASIASIAATLSMGMQAGIISSIPFIASGIPFYIAVSLILLKLAIKVISNKNKAKTEYARALNNEVISLLLESLKAMSETTLQKINQSLGRLESHTGDIKQTTERTESTVNDMQQDLRYIRSGMESMAAFLYNNTAGGVGSSLPYNERMRLTEKAETAQIEEEINSQSDEDPTKQMKTPPLVSNEGHFSDTDSGSSSLEEQSAFEGYMHRRLSLSEEKGKGKNALRAKESTSSFSSSDKIQAAPVIDVSDDFSDTFSESDSENFSSTSSVTSRSEINSDAQVKMSEKDLKKMRSQMKAMQKQMDGMAANQSILLQTLADLLLILPKKSLDQ